MSASLLYLYRAFIALVCSLLSIHLVCTVSVAMFCGRHYRITSLLVDSSVKENGFNTPITLLLTFERRLLVRD